MTAPSSPICARCGEPVTPGARFCMKCGSDVSGEQGSVATAMLPAAQERDANEAVLDMLRQATIGEYEIHKELGRGGMATVYLAHDIALDRKVAIKVMSPALLLMGEGMTERFKREARTAANLSHPHIIPIYTVKSSGKSLFFVMKFISGRSLEAIIKDTGPMPVPMVKAILQQVGNALGYAHRHGIVHRDVKPANIMIDEEGWSVVTDFGIAKVAENRGLTMTGIAVGTPSYMSPEQCAAKDITGKSDQYSLGVVAYEMLTGKQPFEGDSAMAIMFAHFHEQPKPIGGIRTDCPEDLAGAVMRMLEKAPDKRFPSMEDAIGAMSAQPLGHDDPLRHRLIELAKKGSSSQILRQVTPPPTSPAPPAKTRAVVEQATTPIPAPKVISVAVIPAKNDLHVGDTMQLTATPRAAGGTAAAGKVAWSSSDPAVASVSTTGLVTAVAAGKATITANCDGVSGTSQVAVTPVPVAAIAVEPATLSLAVGAEAQLRATTRDQHGATLTGRPVTWSATPAGVVTVNDGGRIVAGRDGAAEVVAECEGVKGSARVTVTPAPVGTITLVPAEASVVAGETVTLEATLADAKGGKLTGREVSWRSAAEGIATVSPRGVVTGIAEGTAEIIAAVEGKTASAQVRVAPAPVASVTIVEPKPVIVGEKIQLVAQLKDRRGQALTGRAVKWSSSSPAVATIAADGSLTGMGQGTAKITAESEGKSWTLSVTVQPVPVAAVTIEAPAGPLTVGGTAALKAIARDAKGNALAGRETSWNSSAGKVATINAQGVVTAKNPGETTITATVDGKKAELALAVAAPAAVAAPMVEAPPARTTAAALQPADSPTEVITPAEARTELIGRKTAAAPAAAPAPAGKGKLIGAAVGILVLAGIGFLLLQKRPSGGDKPPGSNPALPTAATSVATVTLSGASGPMSIGQSRQLAARLNDGSGNELAGRAITWASSDPSVATVSPQGSVTAIKAGSATITATSEGKNGSLAVTVAGGAPANPAPSVASVTVSGGKAIVVGDNLQLLADARDGKGNEFPSPTFSWTSDNVKVATVSSTGLVHALGEGTASITASSEGKSGTTKVTVTAPKAPPPAPAVVASVSLNSGSASINTGQTTQLNATVLDDKKKPLTDRPVTWTSSDERVAKVGSDGTVTGVGKGTATITAAVGDKSATAKVSVSEVVVPVADVKVNAAAKGLKVGDSTTWTVTLHDAKGNPLTDRPVKWTSSAPQVATVKNGVVTAVGPGTADIKAEVPDGKSGTDRVTVAAAAATPAPLTPPAPGPTSSGNTALLPRRAAEAGGPWSCGIAAGGAVCWGGASSALATIPGTSGMTELSVGRLHACGLLAGGKAVCWGQNNVGQLGDGSNTPSTSAVPVNASLSFSAIAAGGSHTCGIADGKAYCWGGNKEGELGDGSRNDSRKPVAVKGGTTFASISAGEKHTCALTSAGKAYCWGDGFSGQLGFGGQEEEHEPIEVSGDQKFNRITAGGQHTCGLNLANKAFCWGSNETGQIGDNSGSDRSKPQPVSTTLTFTDISAGGNHTCAVASTGAAVCWGANNAGQLGDGTKNDRKQPVQVSGGLTFTSISAGAGHTCGMTSSGAVCWGRNEKGQLGDGTTAPRGVPAPVRAE